MAEVCQCHTLSSEPTQESHDEPRKRRGEFGLTIMENELTAGRASLPCIRGHADEQHDDDWPHRERAGQHGKPRLDSHERDGDADGRKRHEQRGRVGLGVRLHSNALEAPEMYLLQHGPKAVLH